MKSSRMTTYIVVAMVLGIATGGLLHAQIGIAATQKEIAGFISIGSMIRPQDIGLRPAARLLVQP